MPLTGDQSGKLSSGPQGVRCRFVYFDTIAAVNVGDIAAGAYVFKDMINVHPRYSWVACSASITLDATDSQQRAGKAAATGHTFTKDSGDGTVTDNGNGTCSYTAPASGSGICYITVKTAGNTTGVTAAVAYGDTCVKVGAVQSFHASLDSGCWELTADAFGSCTGLERQTGVLLVVDDYWNGTADTFGGYKWAKGVFFGWVDRMRTVRQDANKVHLRVKMVGSKEIVNYGHVPDTTFSRTDSQKVLISDFEVVDAAWVYLQESGLNNQINFWFMDDSQDVTELKLAKGSMMDVLDSILGREMGIVLSTKLGDTYLVGDPDIRKSTWGGGLSSTSEFELSEPLYQNISMTYHQVTNVLTPADATIKFVTLEAIDSALNSISANWPETIEAGKVQVVSGIICEAQDVLQDWAEAYWWKVNRHLEADIGFFLMHHVDLLTHLGWNITIRAADLSNYDWYGDFTGIYVTAIDYDINPGMQTWTGSVHVKSYYESGS